ncbi:MAG: hypothetical protein ACSHWN_08505 [Methylophilaceae bacterium]
MMHNALKAKLITPYNIELISEDQYRIVMAVAGFSQDELKIESNSKNY